MFAESRSRTDPSLKEHLPPYLWERLESRDSHVRVHPPPRVERTPATRRRTPPPTPPLHLYKTQYSPVIYIIRTSCTERLASSLSFTTWICFCDCALINMSVIYGNAVGLEEVQNSRNKLTASRRPFFASKLHKFKKVKSDRF